MKWSLPIMKAKFFGIASEIGKTVPPMAVTNQLRKIRICANCLAELALPLNTLPAFSSS
jgi:hypothetical protein